MAARVLVVEDDAILAVHLEDTLAGLGYEVAGLAATGEAAVRLALEEEPDAIIMDIRLRGEMTGIQAAEEIRKKAEIPVIYLTAYTDEILLQQAKLSDAYAYLAKPVRERELRASLEMALYKHRSESRIAHLNQVLEAVRNVNRLITRERDAQRLLEDACHILVRTRGYALVWIGRPEEQGVRVLPQASAGPGEPFLDEIHVTWDESEHGRGAVGSALRLRKPVVFRDLASASHYAPWRERAAEHGFVASAAMPMLLGDCLYGVLTVYADAADVFNDDEIALLEEVANDLAFALKSIEDEKARLQGEEALVNERNLMRTLIDNMPDMIYAKDKESRFTLVNKATAGFLGEITPDLVLGKTDRDYHQPEFAEQYSTDERAIIQFGMPLLDKEEKAVGKSSGEAKWLLTTKVPLRVPGGEIIGLVGINRDITERKQTEIALRTSEAQLSNALKIAQLGPWEYDVAKDTFTFNDLFYAMMRTTAEREGGYAMPSARFAQRFVHPDEVALVREEIQKSSETTDSNYHWLLEHRVVFGDGEAGYILVRLFAIKDKHGRTVKTVGVNQDITERKRAEDKLKASYERIKRAVSGAIDALGLMAETRDPYTSGHQKRVAEIAVAIAREIGLPEDEIETLHVAGILHDIGKVSVPSEILSKPTSLNEIELCLLRNHAQVGYEIVKTLNLPWAIEQIVLQHHERLNGSGYPSGLRGADISLGARIMAVADVVEAMVSHRPYRPALGLEKALEEISTKKGVLYDPDIVEACLRLFREKNFLLEERA